MATASVTCPRCNTTLAVDRSEKAYCPDCHGVWSSRGSHESVHPLLTWIETSADEAMRSPQHGMGVHSCPGCHKPTRALSFFTVPIDWCPACGGVWLDGGELDALREAAKSINAMPAGASPYRVSSDMLQRKASLGTVVCTQCQQSVWVDMTYVTGDGVVCVPCGRKLNNELPTDENAASVNRWLDGHYRAQPGWIEMLLDSILGRLKSSKPTS
ncbi:MAG: zf-TFIIB domain-containing protein [Polyangiales bacterium]